MPAEPEEPAKPAVPAEPVGRWSRRNWWSRRDQRRRRSRWSRPDQRRRRSRTNGSYTPALKDFVDRHLEELWSLGRSVQQKVFGRCGLDQNIPDVTGPLPPILCEQAFLKFVKILEYPLDSDCDADQMNEEPWVSQDENSKARLLQLFQYYNGGSEPQQKSRSLRP